MRKLSPNRPLPTPWKAPVAAVWQEGMATCADCGCDYYRDSFCTYCYVLGTYHFVKSGRTVLYRGFDGDAAQTAFDGALARQEWRCKWVRVEDVLRDNPNPDSEQAPY